jgi:propionate CoA-transferase
MSARKVIARRAAMEISPNSVVNLGIGMPEGVASVAAEEKVIDLMTLTAEPGVIGVIPDSGMSFGAGINTQAVIDQSNQSDFYDGGGLDIAVLGLAQADAHGNLNLSKFGSRLAGAGGFINISQNAKTMSLRAPSPQAIWTFGWKPGACASSTKAPRTSLSARWSTAPSAGAKRVGAASERCVFQLTGDGADGALELIEIAPGMNLERDILAHMDFMPLISPPLRQMDAALFAEPAMGLREHLLATPLA